jgi:hypothetical protein
VRGALVDRCDRCGALLVKMQADQHAAVEAVYEDLEAQLDWPIGSGIKRAAPVWHQLMIDAFFREMGWRSDWLPALNGDGLVPTGRGSQSRLTKRQGSDLIEFAKAWAIERGVVLREWDEAGNLIAGRLHREFAA